MKDINHYETMIYNRFAGYNRYLQNYSAMARLSLKWMYAVEAANSPEIECYCDLL